ncbi:MAG: hypothetical protein ACRD4L_15040, partial [Pyrinomonadaceae bacterium]
MQQDNDKDSAGSGHGASTKQSFGIAEPRAYRPTISDSHNPKQEHSPSEGMEVGTKEVDTNEPGDETSVLNKDSDSEGELSLIEEREDYPQRGQQYD